MTRRRLRPEEVDLWRKVVENTHRLHPERPQSAAPKPRPKPVKAVAPRLPDFEIGQRVTRSETMSDLIPGLPDRLSAAPVQMDAKAFGKMKRGKLKPEARIDLHGMTQDRAHPALTGFILRAQAEGRRLVLVITGKGKERDEGGPIPIRRGVLRHQVPRWLALPPLSSAVLQITPAHLSHGGGGAYYVYLRRAR